MGEEGSLEQMAQSTLGIRMLGTADAPLSALERSKLQEVQFNALRAARQQGRTTPIFTDYQMGIQTAANSRKGLFQTQGGYDRKIQEQLNGLLNAPNPALAPKGGMGMGGLALAGAGGLGGGYMLGQGGGQ